MPKTSTSTSASIASVSAAVLIGTLWAYTPLGPPLGFVPPPLSLLGVLVVLTATYLALVQVVRTRFYRRYGIGV